MKRFSKIFAVLMCLAVLVSVFAIHATAEEQDIAEAGASGITVHVKCESGVPYLYYWNALPTNKETSYPGVKMTKDNSQSGGNWYTYSFSNTTKINLLVTNGGTKLSDQLSDEFTLTTGEWWYKDGRARNKNPDTPGSYELSDLREDSIYFVITTRFYDGDKNNNVHCWDDSQAGNPDTDPAWRGDFKGLADKLDYIKAMGFTAIWITPVVENASGYDYHGYHAMNFSKVDPRYESTGFTYQDLIDAAHEKGIKIIQDVVWNHSGNFGEEYLEKMFTKKYTKIQDLASSDCMEVVKGSNLEKAYPNYNSLKPGDQFQARLNVMKAHQGSSYGNTKEHYHRETSMGYGNELEQQGSMAGDCVDINTENPEVANYITSAYEEYVDMGVDAFRLDTEKHINRWTLNSAYFPTFTKHKNFYIFGEVCARWSEAFNEGGASDSCFFYTWKETESKWTSNWSNNVGDWSKNNENSKLHYREHMVKSSSQVPNSNNVYLNGITYHTPDYSKWNGTGVIDFTMHWNFYDAHSAWGTALGEDALFNDSTWNVTYVDSHDYSPDRCQTVRYNGGTLAWAENLDLMYAFRGIPCVYYGSEIEFQKGAVIDVGPNAPLSTTGRAYFGDNIEGTVSVKDFSNYSNATGKMATTLNNPLAKHIQKLNAIRRAIPALQKGQYTTSGSYVSGDMAFIRRYTANGVDSLACVAISGGATFRGLPDGKYIDAVTGDVKQVSGGTLTTGSIGQGNMRIYVCCASGFKGISGAIGPSGQAYLK
ncbi:MAG: starch-binding protein [Ruminococcus sp.]|nr:starch-binding protein [Ruminococcus sp.]